MARIAILGAGMVGTCSALALQARGHECVLIDRKPPGRETSYGNAGIIQAEASLPYALPHQPLDLLRMAFGHRNAVRLNWSRLAGEAPALWSYLRASAPSRLARIGPLWRTLIAEALPLHDRLIADAGANSLIRRTGYWEVFETARPMAAAVTRAEEQQARFGVGFDVVDGPGLTRVEPALRSGAAGAILWTDPWSCSDPGGLVAAYAKLFEQRGGLIRRGDADDTVQRGSGWVAAGEDVEQVVVALGPWTPRFLSRFGYKVAMVRKRGYHRHYDLAQRLSRPMMLNNHSAVLSPMVQGLRIATAVELPGREVSGIPRQLARAERAARRLLDFGAPIESTPWSGTRPCLPGMLPLAAAAPRHRGLWVHFGHGHQGFTLGPATAWRLADAIDGRPNSVAGLDGCL
tara:strand:+ start:64474 stop:65685 length:1212 start_codon:yes stop_codon:yes gene_type:complete